MLNSKFTLRALLGQSSAECPAGQKPPNECLYWWPLSLTVTAPRQLFRFVFVYVYKAAHMSNTTVVASAAARCTCFCITNALCI